MREAVPILNETNVDVVAVRLQDTQAESLDLITALRAFAPDAHVFFSAQGAESDFLVDAVRHGADDFLADTVEMSPAMIRCLRVAFARKWQRRSAHNSADDEDSATSPEHGTAGVRTFQERCPRYFVTKSAVAIPINPDFTPDQTMCAEGFTIDISKSGVGFEIGRLSELPSELLLAGVEGDDGVLYFATVQVQHWKPQAGRLQVGAKFAPPSANCCATRTWSRRCDPIRTDSLPDSPRRRSSSGQNWGSCGLRSSIESMSVPSAIRCRRSVKAVAPAARSTSPATS